MTFRNFKKTIKLYKTLRTSEIDSIQLFLFLLQDVSTKELNVRKKHRLVNHLTFFVMQKLLFLHYLHPINKYSLNILYIRNSSNGLYNPYGIALHPTLNALYIADALNHRIMSYTLGNNSGTLLFGFNGAGNNNTQLNWPVGLYFDILTNSLVVANTAANNIVRYVLGSSFWTLIAGDISGAAGTTPARLYRPTAATFDPMGNLYVADMNNHRIQFFYAGQLNASTIAGITRVNGTNATTLAAPWSLRLDSQLNLYVADTYNHRIQKFLRY